MPLCAECAARFARIGSNPPDYETIAKQNVVGETDMATLVKVHNALLALKESDAANSKKQATVLASIVDHANHEKEYSNIAVAENYMYSIGHAITAGWIYKMTLPKSNGPYNNIFQQGARVGDTTVLAWIKKTLGKPTETAIDFDTAMHTAVENSKINVMTWIHKNYPKAVSKASLDKAFESAVAADNKETIRWLWDKHAGSKGQKIRDGVAELWKSIEQNVIPGEDGDKDEEKSLRTAFSGGGKKTLGWFRENFKMTFTSNPTVANASKKGTAAMEKIIPLVKKKK